MENESGEQSIPISALETMKFKPVWSQLYFFSDLTGKLRQSFWSLLSRKRISQGTVGKFRKSDLMIAFMSYMLILKFETALKKKQNHLHNLLSHENMV